MIENLWIMSIQACPLILAVLFARLLLQRYPKVYSYSLWMLAMMRLLCPVFIESPFSLQMDLHQYLPEQRAEERWQAVEAEGQLLDKAEAVLGENADLEPVKTEKQSWVRQQDSFAGSGENLLKMLYLAGVAGAAGVFAFQYLRMRRRVAFAVSDRDNIWLCEGIVSPFVMGFIRPRIFLPYGLSENEKIYIVQHERMHIRHGDLWVRLAGLAVLCLHWWNPFVWYGIHRMFQDMEMYCDESVLEGRTLVEKKKYSSILLNFAERQSGFSKVLAFGESNTEKRIKNILLSKKKSMRVHFLIMVFAIVCTYIFLTVPRQKQQEESMENRSELLAKENYTLEEMPVSMQEVILSDMPVLSDGVPFHIQFVMTDGEYFTEEYAGMGGGIYEENYSGNYELRVLNEDGVLVSSCPVVDQFGEERFNFGGPFELALADYNQDGCVDFTLGTWGSSSMGIYYLYTVSGEGEIVSAYPEGIVSAGLEFSKRFEYAKPGFVTYTYNNADGAYSRIVYTWDENLSEYVRGEEELVPEGEEVP